MKTSSRGYFLAALITTVAAGSACGHFVVEGSGHSATREFQVEEFDAFANEGMLDVKVIEGEAASVTIQCDDNLLKYFVLETEDGVVRLRQEDPERDRLFVSLAPKTNCTARVSALSLVRLENAGSGTMTTLGDFEGLRRAVNTGSGDLNIDGQLSALCTISNAGSGTASLQGIDASRLEVQLSGSGNLELGGRADELELSATGSGSTHARALVVTTADVELTGSGSAEINATDCVDISILGSGDVVVSGEARICSFSGLGSGQLVID